MYYFSNRNIAVGSFPHVGAAVFSRQRLFLGTLCLSMTPCSSVLYTDILGVHFNALIIVYFSLILEIQSYTFYKRAKYLAAISHSHYIYNTKKNSIVVVPNNPAMKANRFAIFRQF